MAAPTFIVQLSDPHLRAGDHERARRFVAAVTQVRALDPQPSVVVLTGDIADAGAPEAYAQAVDALASLAVPVVVIPGNHDDRAALRAAFGLPGRPDAPIQVVRTVGPLRLIAADTLVPGAIGGTLDTDWIAGQLATAPDCPTLIALHHPPVSLAFPAMDRHGLAAPDAAAFAELMAGSPQVVAVIAGHVHRAAFTTVGGRPLIAAPSTNLQLDLRLEEGDVLEVGDEPPAFVIHAFTDGRIVSHVQPIPTL